MRLEHDKKQIESVFFIKSVMLLRIQCISNPHVRLSLPIIINLSQSDSNYEIPILKHK